MYSRIQDSQWPKVRLVRVSLPTSPMPTFPDLFLKKHYLLAQPKTLRELEMLKLSATIRRRPDWFREITIPEKVAEWKKDPMINGLTSRQVAFVFQELHHYASLRVPKIGVEVSDVDGVWHSDSLIPASLRQELVDGVSLLEDIPDRKRDWHPGTNNQVWNLVHPSWYPIIYGQTRTTFGVVVPRPRHAGGYGYSRRSCLLPTDFLIKTDGSVSIHAYINNLQPSKHHLLYRTLETVFAKFVPLFERVLTDLSQSPKPNRIQVSTIESIEWDPPKPKFAGGRFTKGFSKHKAKVSAWKRNRQVMIPDSPENCTHLLPKAKEVNLRGRTVQVIVKLANIILTPESPSYPGGSWHVEGMRNESIVASGIYYYDVKNISDSQLGFRQEVSEPFRGAGISFSDLDLNQALLQLYGMKEDKTRNQVLGSVLTPQGRCLAFPNNYQHRVHPCQLTDPTKPGHRKILVFFLVNPGRSVLSTSSVPPQQREWFIEDLWQIPPFDGLPLEILTRIVQLLDWPLSMEKAKQVRDEMIQERKYSPPMRRSAPSTD